MTIKLSELIQKPIEVVTKTYQVNRKKGWGVIAKELGIQPGSKEFHALKKKTKSSQKHLRIIIDHDLDLVKAEIKSITRLMEVLS